jgi:hypothetical protein
MEGRSKQPTSRGCNALAVAAPIPRQVGACKNFPLEGMIPPTAAKLSAVGSIIHQQSRSGMVDALRICFSFGVMI